MTCLHKNYTNGLLKNSKKRKVFARLKDNIWKSNLADMESLSSENRGVVISIMSNKKILYSS